MYGYNILRMTNEEYFKANVIRANEEPELTSLYKKEGWGGLECGLLWLKFERKRVAVHGNLKIIPYAYRRGKKLSLPKFVYQTFKGKAPHGTRFYHTCGHTLCANPQHIEWQRPVNDPYRLKYYSNVLYRPGLRMVRIFDNRIRYAMKRSRESWEYEVPTPSRATWQKAVDDGLMGRDCVFWWNAEHDTQDWGAVYSFVYALCDPNETRDPETVRYDKERFTHTCGFEYCVNPEHLVLLNT